MIWTWLAHKRACASKHEERRQRINELPLLFHEPIGAVDKDILSLSVSTLVDRVHAGTQEPIDILTAYGKKALNAHKETNCLTEILLSKAIDWANSCDRNGPLCGVPVSLKDTVGIAGYDACIGYSSWANKPFEKDSALIRLLRDAGAVPFVKTNIPITLLSFESYSDIFGRTTNPHKKTHSPGGSTGGEAALLAYGGSRIGIGTDVAGSVRIPSHYSGVYTVKASVGRFVRAGCSTSIPGQEGVTAVYSPMARTLEDLEYFWKAVMSMSPWKYDPSCLPIPWRDVDLTSKHLKWGVMLDDGVVAPSPACKRALELVVKTLRKNGHEVVPINPPDPYDGLKIGSSLILADGLATAVKPIGFFETNDAGVLGALRMFRLPSMFRRLYTLYIRYIKRDEVYAGLLDGHYSKSVEDFWGRVAHKEAYKLRWFEYWQKEELDFVLTVPNALPAVPHNGMKAGFAACGYTFLWNVLDYTAGVLPITHVDGRVDKLDCKSFHPRNCIERDMFKLYDSEAMEGLPLGVQVVGQRLEEEKVLEGMKLIEAALRAQGAEYTPLSVA